MRTDLNDANATIFEFLTQKENLRMAMQIRQKLDLATDWLLDQLWEKASQLMESRLRSDGGNAWTSEKQKTDYGDVLGITLVSVQASKTRRCLSFAANEIEWNGQVFGVTQGIILLPKLEQRDINDEISALSKRMEGRGYTIRPGCLAKDTMEYQTEDDFLLQLAGRVEDTARVVVETLWDLFETTKPDVEAINTRLCAPRH